jgi:flagellar export protein FliJ
MSASRSNLETVHRQRQRRVEEIRDEYAAMMSRLRDEETQFERLREVLTHTLLELARRQDEDMQPNELDAYYRFIAHQAAAVKDRREALTNLRTDCETKRAILVHAKQDEQLIAAVERSNRETARRILGKQEQHALDDLASYRTMQNTSRDG